MRLSSTYVKFPPNCVIFELAVAGDEFARGIERFKW